MEYKVMAKGKHEKRHQCYGHHTDSYHADRSALALARSSWTRSVKIICVDGSLKEELVYKAE